MASKYLGYTRTKQLIITVIWDLWAAYHHVWVLMTQLIDLRLITLTLHFKEDKHWMILFLKRDGNNNHHRVQWQGMEVIVLHLIMELAMGSNNSNSLKAICSLLINLILLKRSGFLMKLYKTVRSNRMVSR